MLAILFALAAAAPLPAGTVVAAVPALRSEPESGRTDVTAFLADGTIRVLFSQEHAPGMVPEGSLDPTHRSAVLAAQQSGAEGASVVVIDLASGVGTTVGARAVRTQAPRIVGDVVTWVRAAEGAKHSTFDVVSAGVDGRGEQVRASLEGAWLTPIPGPSSLYLHITSDGDNRIAALEGFSLVLRQALGKGRYRIPAIGAKNSSGVFPLLVERGLAEGRAEVVDERGVVVRQGLAGMDPLAVITGTRSRTAATFVMGAGTKRAALVVREGTRTRTIDLGRAGIATPLAAALVDGALVAVARLDRGRSLPSEIVVVDARGPRVLTSGGGVEVYGIVGSTVGSVGEDPVRGPPDVAPASGATR